MASSSTASPQRLQTLWEQRLQCSAAIAVTGSNEQLFSRNSEFQKCGKSLHVARTVVIF